MPRENTIHQGLIVCTKEYGAFVQLGAWVKKLRDGRGNLGRTSIIYIELYKIIYKNIEYIG